MKTARFHSISVDSTPDISHLDHQSFTIPGVQEHGIPVERFLKFVSNVGHKVETLFKALTSTLDFHQPDLLDCRGQSYSGASNTSGPYSGLQARIKERNSFTVYIPRSAHCKSWVEVISFFRTIHHIKDFPLGPQISGKSLPLLTLQDYVMSTFFSNTR